MLTIVIPTIGRGTLQRAIDSVKNQTKPTKLIIVKDSHNKGASHTRNRGVHKVETDWVGFLDDDDELDKHYHEWLIPHMDNDVVVFKMKNSPNGAIPHTTDIAELAFNEVGISFAMRTKLAKKLRFYNMIGEDYHLLMRVKAKGYKIKIIDKVAYYIHGRDGTN